ncbi:MAG TPA: hypothetical protein VN929_14925 [Burkholderiales bacterium]|nr:hypothetical protein [Burkholderiales bacterium]
MQAANTAFRGRRSSVWTRERIERLPQREIEQLRTNAGTLGEEGVVALCDEALRGLPKTKRSAAAKNSKTRRLISRGKAFEARGVYLDDVRSSWGGVRKSDGMVVLSIWADAIKSRDGACNYLLWAPNVDGSRPWSDTASGQERLKHCRLAIEVAAAEGLLVFGELMDGYIPEDRARSVHGVDPETVVRFKVEKQGEEYWAVWGKKLI